MDEIELNAAQLKCLASPACHDVLKALRGLGQASAAEIARSVQRSPATVHYHLKCLLECGLVQEAFRRPTARKPEAVFEIVAARFRMPRVEPDSNEGELARRAVLAGLRQTMRGYERAAKEERKENEPIHLLRTQVRLAPADTRRFLEMLEEANRFAESHRVEEGLLLHWSSLVYPDRPERE